MSSKLYIANLNPDTTRKDLEDAFGAYGEVTQCHIGPSRNKDSPNTNYGFITFDRSENARDALQSLDGAELNRNNISVQYARRDGGSGGGYSRGSSRNGGSSMSGGGGYRDGGYRRDYSYSSGGGGGSGGGGSTFYRGGRQSSQIMCYKCHEYGHIARSCPSSSDGPQYGGRDRRNDYGQEGRNYRRRSRSRSMS
ncbi:hypothetical protein GJ496_000507 [Pomphorhynchus laevis]|nr:hypothetical protein GJ496_000507 [Pomphorhynchus laevis]